MKTHIKKTFKDFHPHFRVWLAKTLNESRTPNDFLGEVFDLVNQLKQLSWIEDEYRENWHSSHCECDECLAIDKEHWPTTSEEDFWSGFPCLGEYSKHEGCLSLCAVMNICKQIAEVKA